MREISTDRIKIGEHVLIDGEEYVAEKGNQCSLCARYHVAVLCNLCHICPLDGHLEKVKKEPKYRPYKDTEEMIADYKERFNVSNVPSFCMPLIWVRSGNICSLMTNMIFGGCMCENMKELFETRTYLDGSPCGKEVTE